MNVCFTSDDKNDLLNDNSDIIVGLKKEQRTFSFSENCAIQISY